ncbi:MAG: phosphoglycerate mutase [Rhodocyclales bacterium GT-UBC]|nr:MAG: phosphoglycerate mutase [Rhodocyclales bacterium GT-UBC]
MILHLIRHPTPLVEPGICYGRLDLATAEAPAVAAALRPVLPPGLPVWSSPLRRCRALAELLHPAPRFDSRLVEMDFGAWEGMPWDAVPRAELDAWAADVAGFAPPGGESPLALQRRALDFVAGLAETEAVIVTHAGVIRSLLAHWQGLPPERWTELVFAYGSCTRVVVPR